MRCGVERLDERLGGVVVYGVLGLVDGVELELDSGLDACVFSLDVGYELVESYADLLLVCRAYAEHGMCGARNGVAEVAAVDFAERDLVLGAQTVEEPREELVGVGASEVDVAAGVSSETVGDVELEVVEVGGRE